MFTKQEVLEERFRAYAKERNVRPTYNAAPSDALPIILNTDPGTIVAALWGFLPSWSRGRGKPVINARAESLATKPYFRSAFESHRCLVLADGFYEWQRRGRWKIPFRILMKDEAPFAFAGLWSGGNPATFAIITTDANALMEPIHNRMPVILEREHEGAWLSASTAPAELQLMLKPYPPGGMRAYAITTLVNSPAHNVPEIIVPA